MAKRTAVSTDRAPAAVGPYSQGMVAGNLVFVSGQIPFDPRTGRMVEGDIQAQARRSLENVKAVLEAAGCTMSDVVRTTVYLADMNDFGKVNEVYAGYFEADPPARACVEVSRLPKGVDVEIDAIAVKD